MWRMFRGQAALCRKMYSAPTAFSTDSPFRWPELDNAVEARRARAAHLEKLSAAARYQVWELSRKKHLGEIDEETFQERIAAVKKAVIPKAHALVYGKVGEGASPEARAAYLEKYGCVRWTSQAIKEIAKHGPLIEIGAGNGKWKKQLESAGADVVAYDAGTPGTFFREGINGVKRGNHKALQNHKGEGRALLLVYPPDGPMALDCLSEYEGEKLIYVGEGVAGCNADDDFFHELERSWDVASVISLDPYPGCHEKLFILVRKRKA